MHHPRKLQYFTVLLICTLIIAAGGWNGYLHYEITKTEAHLYFSKITGLELQSTNERENHQWQSAIKTLTELQKLTSDTDFIKLSRRTIDAGMMKEQEEFIAYWTTQASSELSAGHLDAADAAAHQVLNLYPENVEASKIQTAILSSRIDQARLADIASIRSLLLQKNWPDAIKSATSLIARFPEDLEAKSLYNSATEGAEKATADRAKAEELYQMARARDQGNFDQGALIWLREARLLAPENTEIRSLFEKFALYIRTLHVPGEFATPAEAIAQARDRDRVVIAEGSWQGPLVIETAIELEGAGSSKTNLQCGPDEGCVITIGPSAKGAHISGISMSHQKIGEGAERFSVVLVRGGGADFIDCHFTHGSGHGLAVIEGAQVKTNRCLFSENGWDGVAVSGEGSLLEVTDCQSLNNYEHGIEAWQKASVVLRNNHCEGNTGNGIHMDNGQANTIIEGNQLIANREFGLVIDSAGTGKISGNSAKKNLLGGLVIRYQAAALKFTDNQATQNEGPGLILEKGLDPTAYSSNISTDNHGEQILPMADLNTPPPSPIENH